MTLEDGNTIDVTTAFNIFRLFFGRIFKVLLYKGETKFRSPRPF